MISPFASLSLFRLSARSSAPRSAFAVTAISVECGLEQARAPSVKPQAGQVPNTFSTWSSTSTCTEFSEFRMIWAQTPERLSPCRKSKSTSDCARTPLPQSLLGRGSLGAFLEGFRRMAFHKSPFKSTALAQWESPSCPAQDSDLFCALAWVFEGLRRQGLKVRRSVIASNQDLLNNPPHTLLPR